ncbi:MAG TPA: hypothetical protein DIW52_14745 [Pseudomonas sp.]|nr:hypothetical protein [Pseudomonas sp.]
MARGLAPVGVRSAPKIFDCCRDSGIAAQPNGGKPPRHNVSTFRLSSADWHRVLFFADSWTTRAAR